MADWSTISSLATAGGTLVLALATFSSVRSANRSARTAEVALQEQRRPLLVSSRLDDPEQKIMFGDGHWVRVAGGQAAVEHVGGVVYLAISLRNVGAGIGVPQAWSVRGGTDSIRHAPDPAPDDQFRAQTRDLYVPAGDIGLWQGALRDTQEDAHRTISAAVDARQAVSIELLYSDQVGEQRTITRFNVSPGGEQAWLVNVTRHWYLDRAGPR